MVLVWRGVAVAAGTGFVSLSDFFELLSNFGRRALPDSMVQRIARTHQNRPKVSFTDFLAYQSILNNLPSLCTTVGSASSIKVQYVRWSEGRQAGRVGRRIRSTCCRHHS
jgi:hypothetical protein